MCKLMRDKCNFVNFFLIIKVVWVSTIPRQAIDTLGIKMTKTYYRLSDNYTLLDFFTIFKGA